MCRWLIEGMLSGKPVGEEVKNQSGAGEDSQGKVQLQGKT